MAKLHGWSPKRRAHRVITPQYSDAELDEPLEIFGFSTAYIEREEILTTRGKLLDRFYQHNNFDGGCNAWHKQILDPPQFTAPKMHYWVFIHTHGYYALVDLSHYGPAQVHRIRLFYQQENGRRLWLASAQLGPVYFYSQGGVATEYIRVLVRREYYIAPKNLNKVVPM